MKLKLDCVIATVTKGAFAEMRRGGYVAEVRGTQFKFASERPIKAVKALAHELSKMRGVQAVGVEKLRQVNHVYFITFARKLSATVRRQN